MKKLYYFVTLMLVSAVLLAGCFFDTADFNDKKFLLRIESAGFLPAEVINNLPDYRSSTNSAGVPLYYWSKMDADGGVIQKIEVNTVDGMITRYHYKSYTFMINADEKLTLERGKALAMRFIEIFRPDLAELTWTRGEWYTTIYDPGNVEAWVAVDESYKYGVMVNLNTGTLDYFSQEHK